jgi:hypothetical protein
VGYYFLVVYIAGSAIPKFDLFHELQGDKLVHAFFIYSVKLTFLYPLLLLIQHKK